MQEREGTAQNVSPVADDDVIGVWRQGKLLVVSRCESRFPKRCVKTNATDDISSQTMDTTRIGNKGLVDGFMVGTAIVGAATGRVGGAAGALSMVEQNKPAATHVTVPLSRSYRRKRSLTIGMGYLGAIGGIVAILACTAGFIASETGGNELFSTILLWGFFASILVIASGFGILLVANQPPLRLKQQNDNYFWLRGAGREFLDTLPEFPTD